MSSNSEIYSVSKKYKVTIEPDNNGEQTTYTVFSSVEGETKHEKDKYVIVKVVRVENGQIIYKYKQFNSHSPINQFVTLDSQEWWLGGRDYMLKLFVNCESGQVFDDPNKREFSKAYKGSSEFIWTGPVIVSPNGHFMFVTGCIWSFPYEWRLYDIRKITINRPTNTFINLSIPDPADNDKKGTMIREIDLYEYLTLKEFDEEDERYQYDADWLGDDELFGFEFVTDNEITVKYWHNKEWKYFNTIDLSNLPPPLIK
jgi:hypothetical protein